FWESYIVGDAWTNVDIPINKDDIIGIIGVRHDDTTLYTDYGYGPFDTTIAGLPVTFSRLESNSGSITTAPLTTTLYDGGNKFGRTFMRYEFTNTAPTLDGTPTLNPAGIVATTESALECNVSASDVDGHEIDLTYVWSDSLGVIEADVVDEGQQAYLDVSAMIDAGTLVEGEIVTCEVTPKDSYGSGTADSVITHVNNRPVANKPTINPLEPDPDEDVTCSATGSDGDSHSITYSYRWTINGGGSYAGAVLNASNYNGGEGIRCYATPNDGYEDGDESVASDMAIVVAPPVAPGTRIFTNCSQTGNTGPSQGQCDTAYNGTDLQGEVTVTSGIQYWTVP
ncbi:MAG: hypothetical protein HN348_36615, partial [Proteobacteria bacterium]|nr:hypothetical protein [Pseudomonadota bacterium]